MMRKLVLLAALSVVVTLAFSSVAMAQYITGTQEGPNSGECSDLAEKLGGGGPGGVDLYYLPDVGGCIDVGGAGTFGPLVNTFNTTVLEPDTGERLGLVKDLDPDLTSGANSVTHQEVCRDFSESSTPVTAQEYFDGYSDVYGTIEGANAKERAILDPNGDGLACTAEDTAFISGGTGGGDTGSSGGGSDQQYGGAPGVIGQPPAATPGGGGTPGGTGAPGDGGMTELPNTGGADLLLPVAGLLLLGSGVLGVVAIRLRSQ